jgi:hypothetical protein
MSRDQRTTRLAGRQVGLLKTNQAIEIGWTPASIARATKAGRIEHPEPGVLRIGGAPETWRQRLLAACMTEEGYAGDRAAAALYRLEGFDPRWIEVTVRRWKRRPNPSVRIRESLFLTDDDVTEVDGIPCVTIEWLLIHLGAKVPRTLVEVALDDALRRGLTTPERLWMVFERIAKPGVRGVAVIRPLLIRRLGTSGRRPNGFERSLYRILERAGLPLPVPQFEIRDGEFVAFADWAYPLRRVVIECVSDEWHSGRVRRNRDVKRRNRITNLGYDVLEFTHDHVTKEKRFVAETCLAAYERGGRHLA